MIAASIAAFKRVAGYAPRNLALEVRVACVEARKLKTTLKKRWGIRGGRRPTANLVYGEGE
jgi:hypothetical protein